MYKVLQQDLQKLSKSYGVLTNERLKGVMDTSATDAEKVIEALDLIKKNGGRCDRYASRQVIILLNNKFDALINNKNNKQNYKQKL